MEILKTMVKVYDFVSLPFYPKSGHDQQQEKQAKQGIKCNKGNIWTRVNDERQREAFPYFESLAHLTLECNDRFADKNVLGYRKLLKKETSPETGFIVKQLAPEYTWISHRDMGHRLHRLTKGLIGIGIKPKQKVAVFMETRMEWILLTEALFRLNATVATLFATLGGEGIVHGMNELAATHIITSNDLLPKLQSLKSQIPMLEKIVVVRDTIDGQVEGLSVHMVDACQLILMEELESSDSFADIDTSQVKLPTSHDVAVIMYTSGSTGISKGVILTHGNLMCAFSSIGDVFAAHDFGSDARHLAYLPLAHLFELVMCHVMLAMGHPIGFGSPATLLSSSPGLGNNCLPDVKALKPEIMAAVPLILDRVRKAVEDQVSKKGPFARRLFHYALQYKAKWNELGYGTPVVDQLLMNQIGQQFGGKLKIVCAAGALLSPETQTFMQRTLNVSVLILYAATESGCSGSMMKYGDKEVGTVGPPMHATEIRLDDWEEGDYLTSDQPNGRGEIVIKSAAVSPGYYKRDEMTAASFEFDESDGKYWFRTGDIGEFQPNGCLRILDRKNCLVKLPRGEFVSLGKVEAVLKCCPLVDNMCLFADVGKNYTVALVIPNLSAVQALTGTNQSRETLCSDAHVTERILSQMIEWGSSSNLETFEIPSRIKLVSETWTPDSGLVTAALKIRRHQVKEFYKLTIHELFSQNMKAKITS